MALEKKVEEGSQEGGELIEKVQMLLREAEPIQYKPGAQCKVVKIGSGANNQGFGYYLTYYDDGTITITLKKYRNQSNSYAIFKVTDKIVDVESLETFLEKMEKIYRIIRGLRSRMDGDGGCCGDII